MDKKDMERGKYVDCTPLNQARERGLYDYLKNNFGEDKWVEVGIPFGTPNDLIMSHCRAKNGIVEVVAQSSEGRGKTNFKDLTENGEIQKVEYVGLVLLCAHFKLLFNERGLCLN